MPLGSRQSEAGVLQVGLYNENAIGSDSLGTFPTWMAHGYSNNFQLDFIPFYPWFFVKDPAMIFLNHWEVVMAELPFLTYYLSFLE